VQAVHPEAHGLSSVNRWLDVHTVY
jgi:hypothetical protein